MCVEISVVPCLHTHASTSHLGQWQRNLTHHLNKLLSSACIHIKALPRSSRLRNSTSPDQPLWKEAWWGRFQRSSSLLHPSPGCRRVSPVTEKTVVCGFYAIPVTEKTVVWVLCNEVFLFSLFYPDVGMLPQSGVLFFGMISQTQKTVFCCCFLQWSFQLFLWCHVYLPKHVTFRPMTEKS